MRQCLLIVSVLVACLVGAPEVARAKDPYTPTLPPHFDSGVTAQTWEVHHDFDKGRQFFWASVGGVAGLASLPLMGLVGGSLAQHLCSGTISRDGSCVDITFGTAFGFGVASLVLLPATAVHATGGERANAWTHTVTVVGAFLGFGVGGVPAALYLSQTEPSGGFGSREAIGAGHYTLAGITAGLGAAWFYQLGYPEPETTFRLSLSPVFTPQGNGFALTVRF